MSETFGIRGVIEGFYGTYYTFSERNDLISYAAKAGFNSYFYGPKQDRYHRDRWNEPYPASVMDEFAKTVQLAEQAGVTFWYVISPVSVTYSADADFVKITNKLKLFYDLGVRAFGVFLDDIRHELSHAADAGHFSSYAAAHVHLCNRLFVWLKELDERCQLVMCPTDYHGVAPFSDYVRELGDGLDAGIQLLYTGPEICAKEISFSDAKGFTDAAKRKPIIWDNYPVNDLAMRSQMHIGPLLGRDARLHKAAAGYACNLMNEAEASKVVMLTVAEYLQDPAAYAPWEAWSRALASVGGSNVLDFLRLFGENALVSCLMETEAVDLADRTQQVMEALGTGSPDEVEAAFAHLESYLSQMDEACYQLKNHMKNEVLRKELVPWIELMEFWQIAGQRAIDVLRLAKSGASYRRPLFRLREATAEIRKHAKQICTNALQPLIDHTEAVVAEQEAVVEA
ncbi:protein O-GlcNAcase [Alicyclobacillus fodiniaquatilis]|uniref:Protein O-GlcNAcase n=1 Tax=Alicyclobacillus fodiniaquatilis TaxID=1661150 RepID=A0ABW4JM46_9BACL